MIVDMLARGWTFSLDNRLALLYVSTTLLTIYYILQLVDTDKERLHEKRLLYVNTLVVTSALTLLVYVIVSSPYFAKIEPDAVKTIGVFSALTAITALVFMLFHSNLGLFKLSIVRITLVAFLISAPLIDLIFQGGIEKFLDEMLTNVQAGKESGGRGIVAKAFVSLYFFAGALITLQYYGEIVRIRQEYKLESIERSGLDPLSLNRAILVFSFAVAFVFALAMGGANLLGLGIFSGLIGAGLSLAFRDLLNNLIAGLVLLWDKSLSVKDVIQLEDGWIGEIRKMTMRYALLEDRNRVEMIVPNAMLIGGTIRNFTRESPEVRLAVQIPVSLGSDMTRAFKIMEEACRECSRVSKNPKFPPTGFFVSHSEYATRLEIRFWINDAGRGLQNIKSEVGVKVTQALTNAGYELPVPRQDVVLLGGQDKTKGGTKERQRKRTRKAV